MLHLRVSIRGKSIQMSGYSKADIARALFEAPEGYSVSEVSKAIPMAYSQAHSVHKALGGSAIRRPMSKGPDLVNRGEVEKRLKAAGHEDHNARRKAAARAIVGAKPAQPKVTRPRAKPFVWKGTCLNCGHNLESRFIGELNTLVHTGVTHDDYLNSIQFCQAFPTGLIRSS